nr:NCK adaptor protein [Hymenolepis microstoma]
MSNFLSEKSQNFFIILTTSIESLILTSSITLPDFLTVTMNAGSKDGNIKVQMKDGEFYIGLKVFTSLEALIENYRRRPTFKNEHEKHFLPQPFHHLECVFPLHCG